MKKTETYVYDEFSDRLMIFNEINKDEVCGSVNVLNLVIDLTANGRIANVEIKNVSDYLKELEIDPSILKELDSAKISVKQLRNGYLLYFILKANDRVERIPFNIRTKEKPILA